MTRLLIGCVVLAALAAPAFAVPPGESDCCACLIQDHDSVEPAFFCVSPASEGEFVAAEHRCEAIPDASLVCFKRSVQSPDVTPACAAQLREARVLCPATAPAPLLGHGALAGAVAALGAVGLLTARRRTMSRR